MNKFVALAKPYTLPPREYEIKGAPKVPKLTVYVQTDGHDGRLFVKSVHIAHAIGYLSGHNPIFLASFLDQIIRGADGNQTRFVPVTSVAPALVRFSEVAGKRSARSTTYKAALNGLNLAVWFDETFGSLPLPQISSVQETLEPITHNNPLVRRAKRKYPVATLLGSLDTPSQTQMRIYELDDNLTLFVSCSDILIAMGYKPKGLFSTDGTGNFTNRILVSCEINNVSLRKFAHGNNQHDRPNSHIDLAKVPTVLKTAITLIENSPNKSRPKNMFILDNTRALLLWLNKIVMPLFYETDLPPPSPRPRLYNSKGRLRETPEQRQKRLDYQRKCRESETPEQRAKRLEYMKNWRANMSDEQHQRQLASKRKWFKNLTDEQREYWRKYMDEYRPFYAAKVRAEYTAEIN